MAIIKIDPLNRIEGHVSVEVDTAAIANTQVAGTMFRGMELIMQRRDPRDVPVLIQRI